jgi:hypothetical protein
MRHVLLVVVLAALSVAGCTDAPSDRGVAPGASLLVSDPTTGLVAVSSVGARNVRVLLVSGPSIVRLREVFVPDGETVSAVHWQVGGSRLIIETDAMRFALDPSTGRLARLARDPAGLARRAGSATRG